MKWVDYIEAVRDDTEDFFIVNGYLDNFKNDDWDYNDFSDLMDEIEMYISGNDTGSYYFNSQKAQEAVKDIIFDDDFYDAAQCHETWYYFQKYLGKQDAEAADVIARLTAFYENWNDILEWVEEQTGKELN